MSATQQSAYHAAFKKHGPFWFWRGWHEDDDQFSSRWGQGVALSEQRAIWAARRKMIGKIVKAHRSREHYLQVDGDELVRLADRRAIKGEDKG